MKQLASSVLVGVLCLSTLLFTGCQTEQIKVVAQNAGLFTAVGWIAMDNPTTEEIAGVKLLLSIIKDKADEVQAGSTYTETIYPALVIFIDTKIEAQYRPLCKAGALSLLGGIDMLFATHPEWKEKQDVAIQIVDAYILGAEAGLGMEEKNAIMIQARKTAISRSKVFDDARPWYKMGK